jgi:hypothetical protein
MTAPVTQVNICESRVSFEQETKEIRRKPGLPPDLLALRFSGARPCPPTIARRRSASPVSATEAVAYQRRDECMLYLKVDPEWDRLRSDPRFKAPVPKVGLM